MKTSIRSIFTRVMFVGALTMAGAMSMLALSTEPAGANQVYNWVHIANNVYHCQASTSHHCTPFSAHSWP